MSQPSVTAYFTTRKRQAVEDLRRKAKEDEPNTSPKIIHIQEATINAKDPTVKSVVRNIQFDLPNDCTQKASKIMTRSRAKHKLNVDVPNGQTDIRETFLKMENKKILFEKKGLLSPKKKCPTTPKKKTTNVQEKEEEEEKEKEESNAVVVEQSAAGSITPKKSAKGRCTTRDMDLNQIKNKINKSSRLVELKASIDRIKKLDQHLKDVQERNDSKIPQIEKFEKIQVEIPVSPQKMYKSPSKVMSSPSKSEMLLEKASPRRRILFEPKETTSPIKCKPDKAPVYQRYLALAEKDTTTLPLPYSYRFLAEVFRCIDTVSAMLYNRKEIITFKKLKPAVQELLRHNFALEHLAQIKTIYPDAYIFHQEKHRTFGSASKKDKYDLILTPNIQSKSSSNLGDTDDDISKQALETSMGPAVLLERKRKLYNTLLEKVKDEHEKFLLNLDVPMVIPREKIMRWHPEFNVDGCERIRLSDLPQPPNVEKAISAKDVLEKAKSLFNCNTRMEKALERLAKAKMTSECTSLEEASPKSTDINKSCEEQIKKVDITIVDTPPDTPTTKKTYLNTVFKGIPKAILEKVRAKQAAKALDAMTRTPNADKEAALYSRLPELAKILRSIFVAEKKGVLPLEHVLSMLDNSFRTKLTPCELEEHVQTLCKLLPLWIGIHNVRKVNYLKLARDVDLINVIKKLEILANDKIAMS